MIPMVGDPLAVSRLVMLAAGVVLSFGFCLIYHLMSHGEWRHNPHGQHLMIFTATIGVVISYILLYRAEVVPDTWAPLASTVIYAAIDILVLWRIILLIQTYRKEK